MHPYPKQQTEPNPMNAYLTAARLASIRQYLDDVAAGVDTVIAWNAHKARVA